jgi:23S rRNA pseudouridine1911/1915/1917 synthase
VGLDQLRNLRVLYEDNHLIAVYKLPGWLVQGDQTGDLTVAERVKSYIKIRYKKPGDVFLGTIHRLDRPVSGALLFARTSKGLSRMNELFRERKINKTYVALTRQRPALENGKLVHYLLKDREQNKTKVFESNQSNRSKNAKKAETHYQIIGRTEGLYLLKLMPVTGRPHQLRAQLGYIGCPIVGDLKYGYSTALPDASIALHCLRMEFVHPVKKEPLVISADLPDRQPWRDFAHLV